MRVMVWSVWMAHYDIQYGMLLYTYIILYLWDGLAFVDVEKMHLYGFVAKFSRLQLDLNLFFALHLFLIHLFAINFRAAYPNMCVLATILLMAIKDHRLIWPVAIDSNFQVQVQFDLRSCCDSLVVLVLFFRHPEIDFNRRPLPSGCIDGY